MPHADELPFCRIGRLTALSTKIGFAVGVVLTLLGASPAAAQQVTVGPLTPAGAPGQDVSFDIYFSGPPITNGVSFDILYSGAVAAAFSPVLSGGGRNRVACSTAAGVPAGVQTTAVLYNGKIGFTVIGLSLDTGPIAFGNSGLLGSCQFTISPDASGSVPLICDRSAGVANASDVHGNSLPVSCIDGALTVQGQGGSVGTGGGAPVMAPAGVPQVAVGGAAPAQPAQGAPARSGNAPSNLARAGGQVQDGALIPPTLGAEQFPTQVAATPAAEDNGRTPTAAAAAALRSPTVATPARALSGATPAQTRALAKALATAAPTVKAVPPTAPEADKGGCALGQPGAGRWMWLLIPLVPLLRRRRSR